MDAAEANETAQEEDPAELGGSVQRLQPFSALPRSGSALGRKAASYPPLSRERCEGGGLETPTRRWSRTSCFSRAP